MRRRRKKTSINKPLLIISLFIILACIGILYSIFLKGSDNNIKQNKTSLSTSTDSYDSSNNKDDSENKSNNLTNATKNTSTKDAQNATTAKDNSDKTSNLTNNSSKVSSDNSSSTDKDTKSTSNTLTEDGAKQIILTKISKPNAPVNVNYDHSQQRDGKSFYVFQVSTKTTNENLRDTLGWFYVDQSNGDVYSWDLINDTLSRVK
ncbi:MAG: hypothetical protein Q8936_07385 [Bacillota bacterium]|nr:hypothetical protein [Bacillota bacterium]